MPEIDFSAAYRDATKGSTIKALQQRRAEAQAAIQAAQQPRQIGSPWQGAAQIGEVISGSIREGRLANQEAASRQRFAQLLAGGLAPDEAGEALSLDHETAMQFIQRNWATEDAKEKARVEEANTLRAHGWDVDAQTKEVEAAKAAATQQQGAQAALQNDAQAATLVLADHNATIEEKQAAQKVIDDAKVAKTAVTAGRETTQIAAEQTAALAPDLAKIRAAVKAGTLTPEEGARQEDLLTRKTEADIASKIPDKALPVTPEEAARWGGDVAKNPQNYYIDQKTGKPALITPYNAAAGAQEKTNWETKGTINSIDNTLNELTRATELVDDVLPMGSAGQTAADIAGYVPGGIIPEGVQRRIDATKRFNQIMESGAMKRMAEELKGSTAYQEIQTYVRILADPNTSPNVKKQTIAAFLNKIQSERELMRGKLKAQGGEDVGDYAYTNPDVLPDTIAPAATEAPPPATGAAAEESPDDLVARLKRERDARRATAGR